MGGRGIGFVGISPGAEGPPSAIPAVGARPPDGGYDSEGVSGVCWGVDCAGVKVPGLLLIDVTGGVLCPPLDDGVKAGNDCDNEAGGGVEVLTSGNSGEDGVTRAAAPEEG